MGLVRTATRLAAIGLLIVGVRKAMEHYGHKAEELAKHIESGDASPEIDALARIHDALHRRTGANDAANSNATHSDP